MNAPQIRVVENRCAHRGVRFCQQPQGNARSFVCPYHQWTYKLNGDLAGLPFKDGVKEGDCVNGGMPAGFDIKDHGLVKLRMAVLHAHRHHDHPIPQPGHPAAGQLAVYPPHRAAGRWRVRFRLDGFRQWGDGGSTLCELGGTGTQGTEHMVTETLIRSMYAYWRKVMGV